MKIHDIIHYCGKQVYNMFGQKPKQVQQVLERHQALSYDEVQLLKAIYADSSEVYSRTFLPLTLINRPFVVNRLQNLKKNVDKLVEVL
jgi:hypothetical protein